ncbi:MAG: hypothetical protein OCD76_03115 [Reichenbachiella sp.]
MTYELVIKPEAVLDIAECKQWYEDKAEELGSRFIEVLDQKMLKVAANPLHYQVRYKTIRMAMLDVFQDAIHFTVEENIVYVHAVLGTARDPKLWK